MAIQFNPAERIIQLDSFNVSGREIWTAMIDWSVLDDNLKYGVGMTQVGGVAPIALYLFLQRGWRIRPKEADGVTTISGYVYTQEGDTPMAPTVARWHRQTNMETPVQAVLVDAAGLTQAQEDKLDQNNSSIASILADTNELQTNQGNFATATGFNTVVPDNASITAILADTNELQTNQGNFATATGFNTVVPDNTSITAILADTAELQTNQGDWLTATETVSSNMRGTDGIIIPANLSTFNPATDVVANVTLVATTTTNTDMRGTDNVTIPADLSTFDPATDTVANVTLVATTTTNTDMRGTDNVTIPADLSTFDPATDTVANVTLVATTTTNTDMRGTDNVVVPAAVGLTEAQDSTLSAIKVSTDLVPAQGVAINSVKSLTDLIPALL